jgi:polysaccharide export outer membrane protein
MICMTERSMEWRWRIVCRAAQWAWIGALPVLTAACGGTQIRAADCPVANNRGDQYLISPGDNLQVFVWRNPELSSTIAVRPDGRVSTPLVEDMDAAGKTPSQLARDLEAVLAPYIRSPQVNIIVGAPGPGNQVQVIGQVAVPQAIPYRDGLRLLDVLVAAGGLSQFAAGNRTILSRESQGGQVECSIRVEALVSGDLSQNINVFPGDVIIVPEARF